jgi:hypothetical protein
MADANVIATRVLSRLMGRIEMDTFHKLDISQFSRLPAGELSITKSVRQVASYLYPEEANKLTPYEIFLQNTQDQLGVQKMIFELLSYFHALQLDADDDNEFLKIFARLEEKDDLRQYIPDAENVKHKFEFFKGALKFWMSKSTEGFDFHRWFMQAVLKGELLYLKRRIAVLYPLCIHHYEKDAKYDLYGMPELSTQAYDYIQNKYSRYEKLLKVYQGDMDLYRRPVVSANDKEWFKKMQTKYKEYFDSKKKAADAQNVMKRIQFSVIKDHVIIYNFYEAFDQSLFEKLKELKTYLEGIEEDIGETPELLKEAKILMSKQRGVRRKTDKTLVEESTQHALEQLLAEMDPRPYTEPRQPVEDFISQSKTDAARLWKHFFATHIILDEFLPQDRP